MKRILALVLISSMFTGCAQVQNQVRRNFTDSVELAKEDCAKMGYVLGTQQFQACAYNTSMNIRNARAQQAAASEAARRSAIPKTVNCHQVGSYITCSEF